jgi:hypothetical protein
MSLVGSIFQISERRWNPGIWPLVIIDPLPDNRNRHEGPPRTAYITHYWRASRNEDFPGRSDSDGYTGKLLQADCVHADTEY